MPSVAAECGGIERSELAGFAGQSLSVPVAATAARQPTTMTCVLHLTNGTAIIPAMRDAGVSGPIVSWDDVLHEGPVPVGLGPVALRERRAGFLAACGWGSVDAIGRRLAERDAALDQALASPSATSRPVDEIVLWFEHDLYDQLQLIQILDRLPVDGPPRVSSVPDDEYLGYLPAGRYQGLFAARRDVTSTERLAARDAWNAFRAPDPTRMVEALPRVSVMPHLERALRRHLEQFPAKSNGLSRTEQQALESIAGGARVLRDVYTQSHHGREEAMFMGDAVFLVHIAALRDCPAPLIRTRGFATHLRMDDEVELTDEGADVLEGRADRVRLCGIDRWLGGVQLQGHGPVWRWDAVRGSVRML